MRIPSTILLSLAAASSTACSSTTSLSGMSRQRTVPASDPARTGSSSQTLTAAELLTANVTTTSEGIRRLRPEFLRPLLTPTPAGTIARTHPSVYLNGVYVGGPEVLEGISLDIVDEIRFVSASHAKDWWGSSCPCDAGVIAVRTKKGE